MSKVRRAAVSGYFYPSDKRYLLRYIEELFDKPRGPGIPSPKWNGDRNIVGIVVPHAGYMYSGWIASYAYYEVSNDGLPENVILIGPNHTGYGTAISVYPDGYWETPLGIVKVDDSIVNDITKYSELISPDESAHLNEHSLEVQIPFLQYLYMKLGKEFKIVPITMMLQNIESVKALGEALYNTIKGRNISNNTLIIASSDFTHYEPADSARKKDGYAIKAILECDPNRLIESIYLHNISMCGYGPVATLLYVAKKLGYCNVRLLKYGNSGDTTGDYSNVVAYASFKISKSD